MKNISIYFTTAVLLAGYCHASSIYIDVGRADNSTSATGYNNITNDFDNGVVQVTGVGGGSDEFIPNGTITQGTTLALVDSTGAASGLSVDVFTQNMTGDTIPTAGSGGDFIGSYPAQFAGLEQSALRGRFIPA